MVLTQTTINNRWWPACRFRNRSTESSSNRGGEILASFSCRGPDNDYNEGVLMSRRNSTNNSFHVVCLTLASAVLRPQRFLSLVLFFLYVPLAFANGPDVIKASRHDASPPLSQMAIGASSNGGRSDSQSPTARATGTMITNPNSDPVAAPLAGPLTDVTLLSNFDGQSAQDNRNLFGFAFVPPDTNGAVGAKQFVQIVNVTIAAYDKLTGALLLGPALINSIWKGFGGPCEAGNGGDPVVLYDQLAGRWLVSQLQFNSSFTSNQQCIAVSTSSDATGSYNRYEFDFDSTLPDYPKFGVWPDAYYYSANSFVPFGGTFSFLGAQACAFDRAAMLAGSAATRICFQNPPSVASTLPPAGQPNFFVDIADSSDLNIFQFHVDFANPASSTFTGPTLIPVAPFTEICARAISLACIPEPPPGERVDGLGDRLMFRLAYRNFGDHESLVVNHTIKGGALAGVRWYEIRSPGLSPSVFQQGTVVDPNTDFWLGSIAMDKAGNIALGFSASSHDLDPSVFVVGRTPGDPAGTMAGPLVLVNGGGVQENSFKRWGDYSSMAIDPGDDCTFWYTQEYYKTSGSFNWSTRISAFKFDSCKAHGK